VFRCRPTPLRGHGTPSRQKTQMGRLKSSSWVAQQEEWRQVSQTRWLAIDVYVLKKNSRSVRLLRMRGGKHQFCREHIPVPLFGERRGKR